MDNADSGANRSGAIQVTVAIVAISALLLGCAIVLLPFFSAILWGVLLCFSTWGIFANLKRAMGGRASLAALTMTLGLASFVVAPFILVGNSLADNVSAVAGMLRHFVDAGPLEPPQWINDIPVAGPHLHDYLAGLWQDKDARNAQLFSLINPLKSFAFELGKALGHGVLEISLSLVVCFFLYRDGELAAARLESVALGVGGTRGLDLLKIARTTLTGVVNGVLGTSIIQGVFGGIGFWIAGVPGAFLLGFGTFVAAFLPMGPAILWVPASIWLYHLGDTGWAAFLVIWSVVFNAAIEHALKPLIIARTGGTPFLIVLFGVLGGTISFGFIGIFLGPALLAVGYAMIEEWSTPA